MACHSNIFLDLKFSLSMTNTIPACSKQMDVVFVLDFSGSLREIIDVVMAFTREVVQGLPFTQSRVRVGLVSYSDDATLHFQLDEYSTKMEVLNALSFRYGVFIFTLTCLDDKRTSSINLKRISIVLPKYKLFPYQCNDICSPIEHVIQL